MSAVPEGASSYTVEESQLRTSIQRTTAGRAAEKQRGRRRGYGGYGVVLATVLAGAATAAHRIPEIDERCAIGNKPTFYKASTALKAAAQVPGSENVDLRNVPLQASRTGPAQPAGNIDIVIDGLYGAAACRIRPIPQS